MKRHFLGTVFASAIAVSATVAAQSPPPQSPQSQPQAPPAAAQVQESAQDDAKSVTVEGCLMREADVPGAKPNVAERAGIAEDFVLTSSKMIKGSAPTVATAPPPDTPVGTSGTSAGTFHVKGLPGDELKQHAGKRVEIEGTFKKVDRAADPAPKSDLVEIRATAIRPTSGECTAK